MPRSTAYIVASGIDYQYRFAGVVSVEYNFALNINADASQGGDIINGARKLPNQIRLSIVETDASVSNGWSASMLSALDSIRRNRVLCTVVTNMGSWSDMLLTEITATEDENNQYGWAGDLVFMQYLEYDGLYSEGGELGEAALISSTRKTSNNSATCVNVGSKAGNNTLTGSALKSVLNIAGIK